MEVNGVAEINDYTTHRTSRELQLRMTDTRTGLDYTTHRTSREL